MPQDSKACSSAARAREPARPGPPQRPRAPRPAATPTRSPAEPHLGSDGTRTATYATRQQGMQLGREGPRGPGPPSGPGRRGRQQPPHAAPPNRTSGVTAQGLLHMPQDSKACSSAARAREPARPGAPQRPRAPRPAATPTRSPAEPHLGSDGTRTATYATRQQGMQLGREGPRAREAGPPQRPRAPRPAATPTRSPAEPYLGSDGTRTAAYATRQQGMQLGREGPRAREAGAPQRARAPRPAATPTRSPAEPYLGSDGTMTATYATTQQGMQLGREGPRAREAGPPQRPQAPRPQQPPHAAPPNRTSGVTAQGLLHMPQDSKACSSAARPASPRRPGPPAAPGAAAASNPHTAAPPNRTSGVTAQGLLHMPQDSKACSSAARPASPRGPGPSGPGRRGRQQPPHAAPPNRTSGVTAQGLLHMPQDSKACSSAARPASPRGRAPQRPRAPRPAATPTRSPAEPHLGSDGTRTAAYATRQQGMQLGREGPRAREAGPPQRPRAPRPAATPTRSPAEPHLGSDGTRTAAYATRQQGMQLGREGPRAREARTPPAAPAQLPRVVD